MVAENYKEIHKGLIYIKNSQKNSPDTPKRRKP